MLLALPPLRAFDDLSRDVRLALRLLVKDRWFTAAAVFALIAILLAAVGLYATTAYTVTQRQQELGVRIALGARVPQVLWLFVRGALAQLAALLAAVVLAATFVPSRRAERVDPAVALRYE